MKKALTQKNAKCAACRLLTMLPALAHFSEKASHSKQCSTSWYTGLELRVYTLSHSTSSFVLGIFKIESCKLFT
jgi:hypothetical protein